MDGPDKPMDLGVKNYRSTFLKEGIHSQKSYDSTTGRT